MKYLKIDCPKNIQEEVEKELQVLRNEHKVDTIDINVHYKQIISVHDFAVLCTTCDAEEV